MTGISPSLLTGITSEHIHWFSENKGLHHEALPAWCSLVASAKLAGFDLQIASSFRDFSRQLLIWNNKFTGKTPIKDSNNNIVTIANLSDETIVNAILLYSALPGASRHHWGTDIDVYAKNLIPTGKSLQLEPWEYQENGYLYPFYQWLQKNAPEYGFVFPYDKFRGGVAAEPWHISYHPLAQQYQAALDVKTITHVLEHADIYGKKAIINNITAIYQQYIINVG